tara:strand:+ start:202 stop:504 length:303 start_codon:yes stop_codon:yes gene_type:complete
VYYGGALQNIEREKMQVKYFTKDLLVKANKTAIRTNRNRSLEPKYLSQLDEDNKYPIVWSMTHGDHEMRVRLLLNADSDAWLDIPFKTYDNLPVVTMPTH